MDSTKMKLQLLQRLGQFLGCGSEGILNFWPLDPNSQLKSGSERFIEIKRRKKHIHKENETEKKRGRERKKEII